MIAPDRHSASAERVDSSSVLVAKVSSGSCDGIRGRPGNISELSSSLRIIPLAPGPPAPGTGDAGPGQVQLGVRVS